MRPAFGQQQTVGATQPRPAFGQQQNVGAKKPRPAFGQQQLFGGTSSKAPRSAFGGKTGLVVPAKNKKVTSRWKAGGLKAAKLGFSNRAEGSTDPKVLRGAGMTSYKTGDFEKARSKTMMILSVLGSGDGKTTEAEKDFIDTARNQLCTIVREQSKLCLVDDPEDESLKKELDEHLRRLLMNLESNGRKTKVRRYAKYQMAEYHIERASIDDKKECNKHLKTMHKMLKEYEREMKLLVQHPTQSEYIVADGDPSTPNDTTSSSSSSSSSTSSSTSSSSSSSRGSRTSKSRTANKQVAYGSECDVHRQHCEYSIVKWEIKLNKMSDKEGIKRYEGKRKQNKK